MNTIKVNLGENSYNVYVGGGLINEAKNLFNLGRKVLVVTDDGVPPEYAKQIAEQCKEAYIVTVPQGEGSKSIETLSLLLSEMLNNGFNRNDCAVAVGGGVVGDLAGFTASCYMRGIDFYNIPTTFLSQVDSSIGGKTAIDFMGLKNIVGAFYPPKAVIIDPETLKTLSQRQISNGLAESVKMSLTSDKSLFELFENENIEDNYDKIIESSLLIKKAVVEADEKEQGLRRILNFGHTLAHAIETANSMQNYYHGECVAMGMLPMCSSDVRARLVRVLKKLNLPTALEQSDKATLINACRHDKKLQGNDITVVLVNKVGEYELKKMPFEEFEKIISEAL